MEDIYCTSSTTLIKIFSAKKPADKKKLVHFKSPVIHSKDPHTVLTWDLKENKYKRERSRIGTIFFEKFRRWKVL